METVDKINYIRDLQGLFQTVSIAPTGTPNRLIDQIVIYTHGATFRLYWFDSLNAVWHWVDATSTAGASFSPSLSPSKSPSVSPS